MRQRIHDWLIGALTGLIAAFLICAWKHGTLFPAKVAQPVSQIAHVQKETLTCKPVVIYKDRAAKNLGVKLQPQTHIAAAANIPFDGHPYRAIATYSEQNGDIDLLTQRLPLPWMAYSGRKSLGVSYGIRNGHSGPVERLDGSYDVLTVKALTLSAIGNVDTGGGWFIGGRVGYSWR